MSHVLKQMLSLVALSLACAATDSRAQVGVAQRGGFAPAFCADGVHVAKWGDEDANAGMRRQVRRDRNGAAR
ncbi:hypothetical protein [Burkholderia multivorans]|uniref:hypothetical protein n=1 Tax=Burkholderia multivorans TaxID=87883 RepID=UPI00018E34A3|nr:hypothetical protein [Burkholderia multivorans]EEE00626.1 putative lipoprotein [Burkholderia multivorans CGD1]MBU9309231.1 hypothetical protein [Burkholderia multivorans]MBU9570976.1 hypothetical protein [Burkholderia multivorans]MDN7948794.1 hypothetical protein [Burkholderia multivorans]MDN7961341.1 hypothetical protein [Burkholderia multivorans]